MVLESQLGVVDAEQLQNRGMQVMHVHRVFGDVVTKIVGLADRHAGLDATPGHPRGEAARMMVAAVVVFGEPALAIDRTPELAAPNHERVVEHAALLEVRDQRRRSLVGCLALSPDGLG